MIRIKPCSHPDGTKLPTRSITQGSAALRIAILLSLAISSRDAHAGQSSAGTDSNAPVRSSGQISDQEIVKRIDAAVYERNNALARYTAQEQYDIYRNGEVNPSAQMTLQTVYSYSGDKAYTLTSQSGSQFLRTVVLDKILSEEREMAKVSIRESGWITSANYEMRPQRGIVAMNGRECLIVDLKPRRKSPHLFNGKIWVDASDFSVLRIEGVLSQSLSIFTGQTTVTRDYGRMDGFSMATHTEARTRSFLLGETVMKINYTGYQIQHGTPAAWIPSPLTQAIRPLQGPQ
jgi:hypothetical protein